MSKKSLQKWNIELLSNLWYELVFYIAETDFTKSLLQGLDSNIKSELLSKVFIVDKRLGPIAYKKNMNEGALAKGKMLEDNMYLLLKMKRKLETHEFDFLLDNYFKQAETCFFITNWIHIDMDTNLSNELNNNLKGILRLQHTSCKEHFGKLIKYFYPNRDELPESNPNVLETLREHFPNLLKKKNETRNFNLATFPKFKKIFIPPKKKELLITEKEVELFLLKSVFNLKNETLQG